MNQHPDELNPNYPVTQQMRDQWHKLCALLMQKFKVDRIEITAEDVTALEQSNKAILVHAHRTSPVIVVMMVDPATGERLARENPDRI